MHAHDDLSFTIFITCHFTVGLPAVLKCSQVLLCHTKTIIYLECWVNIRFLFFCNPFQTCCWWGLLKKLIILMFSIKCTVITGVKFGLEPVRVLWKHVKDFNRLKDFKGFKRVQDRFFQNETITYIPYTISKRACMVEVLN